MNPKSHHVAGLAAAVLLAAGACSTGGDAVASPSSSPSAAVSRPPGAGSAELVVAPYLDVTGGPADLTEIHRRTGLTDFTLAFVLANAASDCTATWGGEKALTDRTIRAELDEIATFGGDVTVSTGGASGTYLERVCSAAALATAYASALDAAGSNHLDVDVEQAVDVDKVVSALARLQASRDTAVSLTVPVDGDAGLTAASRTLLESARDAGLAVTVNAMTMNFDAVGDWGAAMTAATDAVAGDVARVWPGRDAYAMLGVTPMIGVNDTGAVTTVEDARTLLAYAQRKGLGFVRFWSVNRDNDGCRAGRLSPTCSGVAQSDYAFASLFAGFAR